MNGTGGASDDPAAADAGDPQADSARLAEEIRLLVDLVTERAEPWLRTVFAAGHGGGDPSACSARGADAGSDTDAAAGGSADAGSATGSAGRSDAPGSCAWCPLCAVIAVVRGEAPEIAARVLEQAAQLIALLRAVLADRWQPEEGVHMPGYRPAPRPGPPPDPSGFAPRPAAANGSAEPAPEPPGGPRRVQRVAVRPRDRWDEGE